MGASIGADRGTRISDLLASADTGQQRLKMISNTVPRGRLGTPDEIAKAVVFLAFDDSSYISGTVCGWRLRTDLTPPGLHPT
jgi:NAD(P)-dependent dehydrogenase (short-subunit alcohol dehydrogenase family)